MKWKKLIASFLCSILVLANAVPAAACTGIYIGDDVSENGSTYMGRCEDMGYNYVKIFGVSEARDYPEDYVYTDAYGFSMPYGGHVYRYTYIRDSVEQGETMDDFEAYAEAGQNEKGVSVSATVSTYYGKAPEAADPLEDTGICEVSITTILLGKAATAKEAVDLLANMVDTYGSGECNQITISDPNETWYFEIVSGHQYAAIKLPSNKVLVNPNIMMLGVIDVADTENVVASKNLVSLAKDNGFLVTDESGKIDVAKTYSDKNSGSGQYVRYMQGMFYINRAEAETIDIDFKTVDNNSVTGAAVTLLHDADRKMSTLDILHLLSTRGEGTPYSQEEGTATYSIGNHRQAECHVFEIRENMPLGLTTVQWQNVCPSEFSIYIPYYSALLTNVLDKYKVESTSYADNSMFWSFAEIYRMCNADRSKAGAAVKAYFEDYQKSLIEQQKAVDAVMKKLSSENPAKLSEAATELGLELAKQVYEVATKVKAELEAYAAGDKSEAFALSSEVTGTMPEYESLAKKYEGQGSSSSGNSSSGSSSSSTVPSTPSDPATTTTTTTTTNPDGSTTTSTITNNADGSKKETAVEKAADGTVVKTTVTDTAADGSAVKTEDAKTTNSKGTEVVTNTVTTIDKDGKVTGSTQKSTLAPTTTISATLTVEKDAAGAVKAASADLSNTLQSGTKATLSGTVIEQLTEAAGGQKDIAITMTVKKADGSTAYKLKANAEDLTAGNKLFLYIYDSKTKDYIMVNATTYKVDDSGNVSVSMTSNKTYELVDSATANKINKQILSTVKVSKSSVTIKPGKKTTIALNSKVNKDNIKKIAYTSSKKSVATVSSSGKITAKKLGTVTIKAKVTLKNGSTKTVSMKVKVKK